MDFLAKRYKDPYFLLEQMTQQGRLFEFLIELNQIKIEEEDEEKLWDIWLHRVFDKTFTDWRESIKNEETNTMSESDIKATVKNSYNILNGFDPHNRG